MSTLTTHSSAFPWRPDISVFHPADVVPDALILTCSTVCGDIEGDEPAVRVAYVEDDDAEFAAEAATIPESEPGLAEALVYTGKVSQLVRLSSEQYHQDGTAEELSMSVRRAVVRRADRAFLAQPAPTPPNMQPAAGLLSIDGVLDGGEIVGNLDGLIDLEAQLRANGATPTHIITDPLGWAALRKLKTDDGGSNENLLGAGTTDALPMLLNLPVLVNAAMPAYSGVILDKAAVVSAVGQVKVAVSEHALFAADSILLRCTWRVGQNIVRPDRAGMFTVDDGGS